MTATAEWIEAITWHDLEVDPYPIYARLREEAPVAWVPGAHKWLITRWDDCVAVGKDEESYGPSHDLDKFFGSPQILSMEGPEHKALRAGFDHPFRARTLQTSNFEQRVRPIIRGYVERIRPRGRADATRDLLEPISARIVADMLGLDDVDDATLVRWFTTLNSAMNDDASDPALAAESKRTMDEIDQYMNAYIDRLLAIGDDGKGISAMVHGAVLDGKPRSFDDLIGSIRVIILGGFQEPGHGAASSLLGTLLDPAQTQAVLDDPLTHIPLAVHEGLRWIAPFGVGERVARVDVEVGGVTIPAGSEVGPVMAAANRDPSRYVDADRFDLFRERKPHLSFGFGSHYCSGHAIATQLERIMLEEVFAGLPGLELDPEAEPVLSGWFVRSVQQLPVRWSA